MARKKAPSKIAGSLAQRAWAPAAALPGPRQIIAKVLRESGEMDRNMSVVSQRFKTVGADSEPFDPDLNAAMSRHRLH
jgi:hypothetical protein